MRLRMDPNYRRELIKLILDAGLEEDFTQWLRQQGYTHFFGRLDNIPGELIETYVKLRKLIDNGDEERLFKEIMEMKELEPPEKRNYIPARKY